MALQMFAIILMSWFVIAIIVSLGLGFILGQLNDDHTEAAYVEANSKVIAFESINLENAS